MASTYSNLKIELIATGEQSGTWGITTNTNLGTALEEAIVGSADVTFASADVTLTLTDTNASQTARNFRLNLTGTSGGARNLIVPAIEKPYIVYNNLADTVTVKNSTGTGIAIPTGKTMIVYNDGTNVVDVTTYASSMTLGSALPVASGGTGLTSGTSGGVLYYSASGTLASSGALSANQFVIGGGAGSSPTSTTTISWTNTFTAAQTFRASSAIRSEAASTQDAIVVAGRAGGTSSYAVTLTPATLSSSTTLTLPNVTDTVATIGTAQTFTAAQTFRASNAIRSEAASTQDAIVVAGRAGGTSSYALTLTPATLSASRTVTLPDGGGNYTLGYLNIPAVGTKTGSYTLATADVGKYVQVGTSGSITIPDTTFAEGDIISIFNNTTGNITITCSIATAYIAGTDSDKATMTLATRGVATILFISSTVCVVSGNVT